MATLQLELDELKALEETLQRSISDLDVEVGHTDSHDYKETLKRKKALLDGVLQKVQTTTVAA